MSNSEILALLGVIGTFIAPIIAIFIQRRIDNKPLKVISISRKKAIHGKWRGEFRVEYSKGDEYKNETYEMELKPGRKIVKGIGLFESVLGESKRENVKVKLEGGFRNDRFLVLNYNNSEKIQFGTFLMELSPNNEILKGKLVGFGPHSEKILMGDVVVKKVN